jgi:HAMP domain-containing protein
MIGTELSDVIFSLPNPLQTRANLGVLKKDWVNVVVHGHEPTLSDIIAIVSRDELGLLADHFNRMLSRINQFNEELTQRVEAATRELAQRNEELRLANESLFQAQRQLVQAEKLSALGHVSATMAQNGINGPQGVFQGDFGYFSVYQRGEYDPSVITENLGRKFEINGVSIKYFPCCLKSSPPISLH